MFMYFSRWGWWTWSDGFMDLVDGLFSTDWLIHMLAMGQYQLSNKWVGDIPRKVPSLVICVMWTARSQEFWRLHTCLLVDLWIDCSIDSSLVFSCLFGCLVDESNIFKWLMDWFNIFDDAKISLMNLGCGLIGFFVDRGHSLASNS